MISILSKNVALQWDFEVVFKHLTWRSYAQILKEKRRIRDLHIWRKKLPSVYNLLFEAFHKNSEVHCFYQCSNSLVFFFFHEVPKLVFSNTKSQEQCQRTIDSFTSNSLVMCVSPFSLCRFFHFLNEKTTSTWTRLIQVAFYKIIIIIQVIQQSNSNIPPIIFFPDDHWSISFSSHVPEGFLFFLRWSI
jgi:hypothetical protein